VIVNTPQNGTQAIYGTVGGGGFGGRQMFTDAIVADGEVGTADAVLWFFDGFTQTTESLSGGGNSASSTIFTANGDLILIASVLVNSASGLGAVSGITDSAGLHWQKRSSVRDSTGTQDLEVWYALTGAHAFDGLAITVTTSNTVNGDTITFQAFGVGGGDQFGEIWDGDNSLPATNKSNLGGEINVAGFNTINLNTLNLAFSANLLTAYAGGANVAPYFAYKQLASGGPVANMAIEYFFSADPLSAEVAEFDISPTSWLMIADALAVGPALPAHGIWASVEAPDKFTHAGDFTAIGIASPGGWVGFVPAFAAWASVEGHDKAMNDGDFEPLFDDTGWIGYVPAHATMAATDKKDTAHAGGWVIGESITGRWSSTEAKDRLGFSNIGPAVTASWHSTESRDRMAATGFEIPKVPIPPTPRRRRLLIIS
jgi:hypothetical protein